MTTTEQVREEVEQKFVRGMLIRRLTMEFKMRSRLMPDTPVNVFWMLLRECEEGGN